MRLSHAFVSAVALSTAAVAFAQSAVLHDGTVVTMKVPQELFSVEGPLWDIDLARKQLIAVGHKITIPASLNGEVFILGHTQIVNNEETVLGPITVQTFDRLADVNAATRDRIFDTSGAAGPIRLGPVRSLFSTSEARGTAVADLDRDPLIEKQMEDNYFFLVRNAFLQYAPGVLPQNFLGLIGIRTENGGFPTNNNQLPPRRFWRYPTSTGATIIADGSIYVDSAGNEYKIPDFMVKGAYASIVIAENIVIGNLRAAAIGNWNTPDSFIVGETLVVMNQDPRMPCNIIGIAGSPVSREYFTTQVPAGRLVAVEGHMIGEHVMFAESIDVSTDVYDPAAGAWMHVLPNSWRFRPGRGLEFRGELVPAAGQLLHARLGTTETAITLVPDAALNMSSFDVTNLAADPVATPVITFVIRDAVTKDVVREFTFNWVELLGL
jgi:hypothetical protein